MSTIFVTVAGSCEGYSTLLKAFSERSGAEHLAQLCREHDSRQPQYPAIEDTPENDAAFERVTRAIKRWSAKHPAGKGSYSSESYVVIELELIP